MCVDGGLVKKAYEYVEENVDSTIFKKIISEIFNELSLKPEDESRVYLGLYKYEENTVNPGKYKNSVLITVITVLPKTDMGTEKIARGVVVIKNFTSSEEALKQFRRNAIAAITKTTEDFKEEAEENATLVIKDIVSHIILTNYMIIDREAQFIKKVLLEVLTKTGEVGGVFKFSGIEKKAGYKQNFEFSAVLVHTNADSAVITQKLEALLESGEIFGKAEGFEKAFRALAVLVWDYLSLDSAEKIKAMLSFTKKVNDGERKVVDFIVEKIAV